MFLVLFCIAYDEWWAPMRDALWANGVVRVYDWFKIRVVWRVLGRRSHS